MNTSRNITDLPLELLGLIFKKLPSLEDQVCLAQVHPHIGLAFSCHYSHMYTTIYELIDEFPNEKDWSVILPLCGSSVETIYSFAYREVSVWKLVKQHCPNLQSIEIRLWNKDVDDFKLFLGNVRSLRSVSLYNVDIPITKYNLGIVDLLKLQPNLKMLALVEFGGEVLLEVRNFVNLETLLIISKSNIHANIDERLYRLEQLKSKSIKAESLTASEFEEVPCPALKDLSLHVELNYLIANSSTPAILKWILSHSDTLETLCYTLKIADLDIVIFKILSECRNLRYFNMPINSHNSSFAHRLIEIVSENGLASETRQLSLNFCNQRIHDDIQKEISNSSAKLQLLLPKLLKPL